MDEELGDRIRRRRAAAGLSLEALSQRSGVSRTMLSEIERGLKNPTVKLAYQVAHALGCSLSELVEEPRPAWFEVERAAELRTLVDPETKIERRGRRTQLARGRLEVAWYVLPPGTSTGQMAPNRPGLIERITVVTGSLEIVLGGQSHLLGSDDTVTYGVQATEYRNNSDGEACRFVLISDATLCEEGGAGLCP